MGTGGGEGAPVLQPGDGVQGGDGGGGGNLGRGEAKSCPGHVTEETTKGNK